MLADGSILPKRGRITFADAEYNQQTGTFLVRATFPNPKDVLRPGQFVRARVHRRHAPERDPRTAKGGAAGRQGAFCLGGDKEGKAEQRPVVVGDWIGNDWFITEGLSAGDQVVVDGGLTLRPVSRLRLRPRPPRTAGDRTGCAAPKAEASEAPTKAKANKGGTGL